MINRHLNSNEHQLLTFSLVQYFASRQKKRTAIKLKYFKDLSQSFKNFYIFASLKQKNKKV